MRPPSIYTDARYFQVVFQLVFLIYGIVFLNWQTNWLHYSISIMGCLVFQYLADSVKAARLLSFSTFKQWGFSILISALSLCLLLKTNNWYISLLAAFITVAGKYVFRFQQKHIFNPSALGMVATIFITGKAWLSPAQWGNGVVLFFAVLSLGFIVVTKVQKLDVSLAFLISFSGLLYWRQIYILGWPMDYFWQSVSTGSLLLFTFFMISDPRTAPNHPMARILWAASIAAIAFYLAVFKWMNSTPVWVLVIAAPLVPVLNYFFEAKAFEWKPLVLEYSVINFFKSYKMERKTKKIAAMVLLFTMLAQQAGAFCGFYVSKADGALKNKTSQVILVRDGNRTVITMSNDFKGNVKDFAMVVPVPVVLKKNDIKIADAGLFQRLNDYSAPRLVEYYDENPCQKYFYKNEEAKQFAPMTDSSPMHAEKEKDKKYNVTVEAQYTVGEYDIVILSAEESGGLKNWLHANGYKIPADAEEVLQPYIKSNLKFFVVKVNLEEQKATGAQQLRPLQISFESPKFMLPIRLGMANADGDQDMIVYAFTRSGRVEATNYRTVSLPTGKNIPLFVQNNFGNFYTNLFNHQWKREGKNIALLEYAWDVSPSNYVKCDPCVSEPPNFTDFKEAGVWWLSSKIYNDYVNEYDANREKVFFTRLHVRYNRLSFAQDLQFQVTPNTENFQARYIVTHPANGDLTCEAGKKYLKELKERRKNEMEMLAYLTGKGYDNWHDVATTEDSTIIEAASYGMAYSSMEKESKKNPLNRWVLFSLSMVAVMAVVSVGKWQKS